jgi:hypothetical protein
LWWLLKFLFLILQSINFLEGSSGGGGNGGAKMDGAGSNEGGRGMTD